VEEREIEATAGSNVRREREQGEMNISEERKTFRQDFWIFCQEYLAREKAGFRTDRKFPVFALAIWVRIMI